MMVMMMMMMNVVTARGAGRHCHRLCAVILLSSSLCCCLLLLIISQQQQPTHGFSAPSQHLMTAFRPPLTQQYKQQQPPLHSTTTQEDTSFSDTTKSTKEEDSGTTTTINKNNKNKNVWFPRRIQETIDYDSVVERLYLRHVVTETKEMAQVVLLEYQKQQQSSSNDNDNEDYYSLDPFADLASRLSACTVTRDDGGTIGWVDRNTSYENLLPGDVVEALYKLQPKVGDIHILYASESTQQYHVIQIVELWINPLAKTVTATTAANKQKDHSENEQDALILPVGSHSGYNAVLPHRTLKGIGVTPTGFGLLTSLGDPQPDNDDDNDERETRNTTIMRTYSIQTAGCQMNVADSERMEGILQHELHMTKAMNADLADLIILNTCSIRDRAEQQVYNALGPFAARKRNGQHNLGIVVTGCVAQQEGEDLLRRVPEVDVVLGPQYVPFIKNVLEQVAWGHQVVATAPMLLQEDSHHQHHQQQQGRHDEMDNKSNSTFSTITSNSLSRIMVSNDIDRTGLFTKPVRGHDVRAWVNVISGCNEHCTYCVVPATRGMEQSRSMEAILQECLQLAETGYKEVTLLGQNIDAYGRDMIPKRTFADLLHFLNNRIPTKMRIRYVTSHPRYFSNRVIDAVANLDKVCECFHMPFQAGDDAVLRAMRRGYDVASYMRIINKIREKAPDSAICADVIVGFPGETDAAFERTLELMEKVKFDNLNSFAYSPRPNTEAALWEHNENKNLMLVPENVKAQRLQRVQQLAAQHGLESSMRYVGRIVEVLVEDANPRNPLQQVMGRTRQGRQVYFDGCLDELRGEFVQVHITKARTWSLMGELVSR